MVQPEWPSWSRSAFAGPPLRCEPTKSTLRPAAASRFCRSIRYELMVADPMPIVIESPSGMILNGGADTVCADPGETPAKAAAAASTALSAEKITQMTSGELKIYLGVGPRSSRRGCRTVAGTAGKEPCAKPSAR